jgi:hypothetical protein
MTSLKGLPLITGFSALLLMVGLTGCASGRYHQTTRAPVGDNRATVPECDQSPDQRIEDSRTAERVREALVASADYKYDGVKVTASSGGVQLSGVVNTRAQRNRAGEVTSKVAGVKSLENNLMVRD